MAPGIRPTCARRERRRKPSLRTLGYPVDQPKEIAGPLIRVYRLTYASTIARSLCSMTVPEPLTKGGLGGQHYCMSNQWIKGRLMSKEKR